MMRKYKFIGALYPLIIVIVVISCKTRFETNKAGYDALTSQDALARGRVLVYSICAGCHYNRAVNKFIGNKIEDVPGIAGKVYSANLTHSKTHGVLSRYSDAEIRYLLKTGIARDGRFLSYMLRPNMADEDINAIIVFLRSDDPGLAATDTTVGLTHFTLIGKMFLAASARPAPFKTGIKRPSENEPVALGRYLVDNLGCYHCHSKSLTKLNYLYPEQSKGYLAGGARLKGENGTAVIAANITPDRDSGIGNFSEAEFLMAVKKGEAPNRKLRAPMPRFQKLNDREIDAIYAYLQTVPPIGHHVK